ncbi:helix-turn-helix domain-containing protein [Treponema primitia]|uniref:helix-turn-helix domain-containing protein n=1 Tax=Treponema primitia TaxID=88058 RepID=UPI00397FAE83
MESLGDKLRTTRESKGYTFDYIGRETNIATRYLEALETENFSVFPGEPYLLGFLRNYGEYLGLDVNELLAMYRAWKIQEQPIPVEQLLKSPSKLPKILLTVFLILAGVAVVGGGVYFFMRIPWKANTAKTAERPLVAYTLEGSFLEQRFYRGDSILIPLGGNQYKITLFNLGEAVTLAAPMGNVILDLGQERSIDINSDGLDDIRVGVQDFVRNDPSLGVRLRFDINSDMGIISENIRNEEILSTPAGTGNDITANNASNIKEIFKSANAYPFTLQASFQGYCMFRWELLREPDRPDRQEQYFVRTNELDIQAKNGIRIWVSNATAVKLQVIVAGETKVLEIGGAGEVVVTDIRWVRDDDGRFRLAQIRID